MYAIVNENINWINLSANKNAIPILEKHLNKVQWDYLSGNTNAIHLLFKMNDKFKSPIGEELVSVVMNPNRLLRLCEKYQLTFEELLEYF